MRRPERYAYLIAYFTEHFPAPETELAYSNPFELLLAVVLSAQCTDKRINLITPALFARYPTPAALAASSVEEIFGYIRSVTYPNNKAKHLYGLGVMLQDLHAGQVPALHAELVKLPGVGRKTANVIVAVIFNQPAMAVDTHVYRVARRMGLVAQTAKTPLAVEQGLMRHIPKQAVNKAHHWLILHGRYVCLARSPRCSICPLLPACTYGTKLLGKQQPLS